MINEFLSLMPLVIISVATVVFIVLDGILKNKKLNFWGTLLTLIVTFVSVFISIQYLQVVSTVNSDQLITKGIISFNGISYFFDLIFLLSAILTLLSSRDYQKAKYIELNEFYSLILFSVLGMMIISHSNNLLTLFLGIETMSLSFYVLAGFFRKSNESVESAIKYFLLGAFATGFLVYGIAFIYGATKSLDFTYITGIVQQGNFIKIYFLIGSALVLIGLSFKIAAFPFHQWAPDVYTGSPTTIAGFMSTAGKASAIFGFYLIFRYIIFPYSGINLTQTISSQFQLVLAIISALTMLVGNFIALVQKNVKRMLAYSSVAHAGYLLMGIVSNNPQGWNAIAFYSLSYLLMQLGAFLVLSTIENTEKDFVTFEDFSGFSKKHPFVAATMSVFMLSLAGIPPLAGFFGKYLLFVSAIKAGFLWLTIIAVISSIISMYYYIGLILFMYFKEEKEAITPRFGLPAIAIVICLAGTIIFGIVPQYIVDFTDSLLR